MTDVHLDDVLERGLVRVHLLRHLESNAGVAIAASHQAHETGKADALLQLALDRNDAALVARTSLQGDDRTFVVHGSRLHRLGVLRQQRLGLAQALDLLVDGHEFRLGFVILRHLLGVERLAGFLRSVEQVGNHCRLRCTQVGVRLDLLLNVHFVSSSCWGRRTTPALDFPVTPGDGRRTTR